VPTLKNASASIVWLSVFACLLFFNVQAAQADEITLYGFGVSHHFTPATNVPPWREVNPGAAIGYTFTNGRKRHTWLAGGLVNSENIRTPLAAYHFEYRWEYLSAGVMLGAMRYRQGWVAAPIPEVSIGSDSVRLHVGYFPPGGASAAIVGWLTVRAWHW